MPPLDSIGVTVLISPYTVEHETGTGAVFERRIELHAGFRYRAVLASSWRRHRCE
jgi:hypothetical protein